MSVPTPPEDYTYPEDYVPPLALMVRPGETQVWGVSSMTLHITKGTPPNEVTYTESIPYASIGENSFAITNQLLVNDFSNKPPGTKYSYHITTNYVPGRFPTGDVVTTPTITNQTVKAITNLGLVPFSPYNPAIEEHSILETVSSTSNGALSFLILSSDLSILSIEPVSGEIIAVGPGTATVIITQSSTPEYEGAVIYEKIIVESTPEGSLVVSVEESWLRLLNNVTIRDTKNLRVFPSNLPVFVEEDPRGTGTPEWFAIVDNRHRQAITNYARGVSSTPFIPPGQSTPVPFNNIVTTHVTNMTDLFQGATAFNSDISSWDTSRVTSMVGMFANAIAFDQPLNSWDTSGVRVMDFMFANARAFNRPLNSWNVSNVAFMFSMFLNASAFNGLIGNWNTSRVRDMSIMFAGAIAFNQNINTNQDTVIWRVSQVTSFQNFRAGSALITPNTPLRFVNAGQ